MDITYLSRFFLVLALLFATTFSFGQISRTDDLTPLQHAINEGNIAKIKQLIADGSDVNKEGRYGVAPIETAIRTDRVEIVKTLLLEGVTSKWGMQFAVANNNAEMVRVLINHEFSFGPSLIVAAENDNLSMVHMLVKNGAKVQISQKRKKGLFRKYYVTPIEMAVKNGNKAMVHYLIKHGVPLSEAINECFFYSQKEVLKSLIDENSDYGKFMEPAFQYGDKTIIEYLLSKGADIHCTDSDGSTMLHIATAKAHSELVRFCIEDHNLKINKGNNLGETPLMLAVQTNSKTIANYLIDKGAILNQENNRGETALFYSTSNSLDMFHLLINAGADVSQITKNKTTLLINSAKNNNHDVVTLLLENGANIEPMDDFGYTAFQYLISSNNRNYTLIKLFIDKGADINAKDVSSGESLMFYAIESESLPRIQELIRLGASVNVKNKNGNRPRFDDPEVIMYIIDNGADINAVDSRHDTYLCVAINDNDLELAHYLISKGIDVNQNCYFTEPPIIKAIEDQNIVLVKFLADNGSDLNAIGYFDRNVMEYAEREGNKEIIDFLKERGAMTKSNKNELFKASMEMERKINTSILKKNEEQLAALLKEAEGLIIQEKIIERAAVFAAEEGNPLLVELLLNKLDFDINSTINTFDQTLLMIATIKDETSLVSYLINKGCDTNMTDSNGKIAREFAESKAMKKLYKPIK